MAKQRNGFWKKDEMFYCRIRFPGGESKAKSTGCHNLEEAKLARSRMQYEALHPSNTTENQAKNGGEYYPLSHAIADLIQQKKRLKKAAATIDMYEKKAGHLVRIIGADADMYALSVEDAEAYVDQRDSEGGVDLKSQSR